MRSASYSLGIGNSEEEKLRVSESNFSQVFTNGITNKIFSVFRSSDPSDRVVFRVFGENTEKIIDRLASARHNFSIRQKRQSRY